MTRLLPDLMRARARNDGASPLVTYYDLATGERTELSGTSFANWVDKTSNLLADEYLLAAGARIDLKLAVTAPGHWMTLVLELAAWQVGASVQVTAETGPCDLLVLGPDWEQHDRGQADAVLACSLHPLGLGFPAGLPADVADFSLEVRGQSDHHSPSPRTGAEIAWVDGSRSLTQADLVAVPNGGTAQRQLVRAGEPWPTVRDGLVVPVLTGGSAVLVAGDGSPAQLTRIQDTERVQGPGS